MILSRLGEKIGFFVLFLFLLNQVSLTAVETFEAPCVSAVLTPFKIVLAA